MTDRVSSNHTTTMNKPEYHNPSNLSPEQIGDGYELLTVEENKALLWSEEIMDVLEGWNGNGWVSPQLGGSPCRTYRRKKPTPSLVIEPGKFYRTRDGRKARVYAVDGESPYSIHGAVLIDTGWQAHGWTICGSWGAGLERHLDIVAPWIDLPEVDWSKLPDSITCVTADKDGEAWAWTCEPDEVAIVEWAKGWDVEGDFSPGYRLFPGTVTFTGDWTQSKVCRPEGGAK